MNERLNEGDVSRVETLHAKCAEIRRELAKRVVGQEEMVDQVLTAVFARGHALLTGVPGLAKTLSVNTQDYICAMPPTVSLFRVHWTSIMQSV